jgi:hypothetical protein
VVVAVGAVVEVGVGLAVAAAAAEVVVGGDSSAVVAAAEVVVGAAVEADFSRVAYSYACEV